MTKSNKQEWGMGSISTQSSKLQEAAAIHNKLTESNSNGNGKILQKHHLLTASSQLP